MRIRNLFRYCLTQYDVMALRVLRAVKVIELVHSCYDQGKYSYSYVESSTSNLINQPLDLHEKSEGSENSELVQQKNLFGVDDI